VQPTIKIYFKNAHVGINCEGSLSGDVVIKFWVQFIGKTAWDKLLMIANGLNIGDGTVVIGTS